MSEAKQRNGELVQQMGELAKLEGKAFAKRRSEYDELERKHAELINELGDLERRLRAAERAEADALADARTLFADDGVLDAEQRERLELRGRARLTEYFRAATSGKRVAGAERELQEAASIEGMPPVTGIPIELFDVPQPRAAVTEAPATVGVNLDPIRPAVFAQSIASRLGIEMPRVMSGTYATGTITTSQEAEALAKSAAPTATAGAITVTTATPKRVSARLELTLEDIAAVGVGNFESILRQNLMLALGDQLDDQMINGNGTAPNLRGILTTLNNPDPPEAGVADFDDFVAAFASGVDGLWASTVRDVAVVANPETYKLSVKTFRDATGQDLGDTAFSDYAMEKYGGWWTNKRMPDKANHIAPAILYRMGRSAMGADPGMRTAVCPHWGEISIDDPYTGSAKAERYFTVHVLLGDVILVQPDAYAQVDLRVSA